MRKRAIVFGLILVAVLLGMVWLHVPVTLAPIVQVNTPPKPTPTATMCIPLSQFYGKTCQTRPSDLEQWLFYHHPPVH